MAAPDLVKLALEHALAINDAKPGPELQKRLRSRARSLPSLVMDAGLVPALLFYLSKSSQEAYERAVSVLPCNGSPANSPEALRDSNEEAYALISRAVLCALKALKIIDDINDLPSAIRSLKELRGTAETRATMTLEEYLVNLKRTAEALWEEGEP